MHDMHCHILPDVDDGARTLSESLAMVAAAKHAGITSATATPHVRDPYFDYGAMQQAYLQLAEAVSDFPLQLGWEVNHHKLMELGMDWARHLAFAGTNVLLLELSVAAMPSRYADYERTIFQLQGLGFEVVIAHPERYVAIQQDIGIAEELVSMGCKLQVSTDFIAGGRLGQGKRPALRLLRAGLVSYLASDAHRPVHYDLYAKAWRRYADLLVR